MKLTLSMSKENCRRRLKSQICVLFVYKFVVFVLLLKTRTSWYWWWNFLRKTQHPWIALLLSALDFLLLLFPGESAFQFELLKSRANQYFWHTFLLVFWNMTWRFRVFAVFSLHTNCRDIRSIPWLRCLQDFFARVFLSEIQWVAKFHISRRISSWNFFLLLDNIVVNWLF